MVQFSVPMTAAFQMAAEISVPSTLYYSEFGNPPNQTLVNQAAAKAIQQCSAQREALVLALQQALITVVGGGSPA